VTMLRPMASIRLKGFIYSAVQDMTGMKTATDDSAQAGRGGVRKGETAIVHETCK
jgi:hypothetical protein